MNFQVRLRKYGIKPTIEAMVLTNPEIVEFRATGYSWKTTRFGTISLNIEDSESTNKAVIEVENTQRNMVAITRLIEDGLKLHADNCILTFDVFCGSNGYTELNARLVNIFTNCFLYVQCVSDKPIICSCGGTTNDDKIKEFENIIHLDIHKCLQDKELDSESYILKSVHDMWARIDNDETFGVLTAKPYEYVKGRNDVKIVIGPILFTQLTDDLSISIATKLQPFMKAFRNVDLKHEIAKVIVHEVYATREAYERNEMSCVRLELYVEDVESNVGKIEKVEIYL